MPVNDHSKQVERWSMLELIFQGTMTGNPFVDITLKGDFTCNGITLQQEGFYDGQGIYRIRMMPHTLGTWTYRIHSNCDQMDGISGQFECICPSGFNHGVVRVRDTYHFAYDDGTPFYPFGTTCYAWNHQGKELEEQTLESLSSAPFNKIRMCVFPKYYDYNHNEPELYPFEGDPENGWDYHYPG